MMAQLRPIADHLEKDIFPFLQQSQTDRLILRPDRNEITGISAKQTFQLSNSNLLADFLISNNIEEVEFDVLLENNQILESMLILFYCIDQLTATPETIQQRFSWKKSQLTARLLSDGGIHKFCSEMRFIAHERKFVVKYSYCELAFSRFISSFINHQKHFQDHRALFNAALPAAGIYAFICVLFSTLIYTNPSLAFGIWISLSLFITVGIWTIIRTIGSLRYDREHRDQLIRKYIDKVSSLSRFPEADRNPVIKMNSLGEVLYCNPAAQQLLTHFGFDKTDAKKILPPNILQVIQSALAAGVDSSKTVQTEIQGRYMEYVLSCFEQEPAVIIAGRDITHIRKMEEMLLNANLHLEDQVEQRTADLNNTQDITILCLAGLAETRDPETGEHLQRTRLYVKIIAEFLQDNTRFQNELTSKAIEQLYKSAPLHDIGKVGVPDTILLKPGRLTDEEFEIMKKHTIYGGDTLQRAVEQLGSDSFLKIASEIAYAHHERWDGKGYPYGLKEEEIPVSARLMAIADVYDALTSKRVYKEAFSHQKAKEIILDGRETQFDPDIVDAFIALEEQFVSIANKHQDRNAA